MENNSEIKRLAGPRCELGEGAYYDRNTDTGWWFDIKGKALFQYQFPEKKFISHDLPKMASVIARIDNDHQLVVLEDGIYVRVPADSSLQRLAALEADIATNRSNDGRVHPSGSLWIGTMGKQEEKDAGSIYWFDGNELRLLFSKITIPNSICFSPDGTLGYFADTALNIVWRINLDAATGLPKGEPEVFLNESNMPTDGYFDGAITDADGIFWSASWGGGAVSGFTESRTLVKTYELPAKQVTCPSFAGPKLDKLMVTTAWKDMSESEKAAEPGAGFTYLISDRFKGKAEPAFKLKST